jgi:hypothetical protein
MDYPHDPYHDDPAGGWRPYKPEVETIIMDQYEHQLAILNAALWPPKGAVIELGKPNRDAVVQNVRMRLSQGHASILVDVVDTHDQSVERVISG